MSETTHREATLLPLEAIALRITVLRGQRVIIDADLAALYDVPTKRFNEAVKRNLAKFPPDFMFTLSDEEFAALRSQSATSNAGPVGRGGRRYAPRVFTEHGALMAATILSSPRAIEISVYVMRAFVRLRELATQHADLAKRLSELEDKTEALALNHDTFSRNTRNQLKQVFDALRELMTPPEPPPPPKRSIGFGIPENKGTGSGSSSKGSKSKASSAAAKKK
jgi:ORF6N domain